MKKIKSLFFLGLFCFSTSFNLFSMDTVGVGFEQELNQIEKDFYWKGESVYVAVENNLLRRIEEGGEYKEYDVQDLNQVRSVCDNLESLLKKVMETRSQEDLIKLSNFVFDQILFLKDCFCENGPEGEALNSFVDIARKFLRLNKYLTRNEQEAKLLLDYSVKIGDLETFAKYLDVVRGDVGLFDFLSTHLIIFPGFNRLKDDILNVLSIRGYLDIVQFLGSNLDRDQFKILINLEKIKEVCVCGFVRSVLSSAIYSRNITLITFLLEHGAIVSCMQVQDACRVNNHDILTFLYRINPQAFHEFAASNENDIFQERYDKFMKEVN